MCWDLRLLTKFSDHSLNIQEAEESVQEGRELKEEALQLDLIEQALTQFHRFHEQIQGKIADDKPIKEVAKITPNDKNPDFLKMEELNQAVKQVAQGHSSRFWWHPGLSNPDWSASHIKIDTQPQIVSNTASFSCTRVERPQLNSTELSKQSQETVS